MIEIAGDACPTAKMCETLEVSRSAYYQWLQRKRKGHVTAHAQQDQRLSRMLVKLHQEAPSYGLDTLHAPLRKDQPVGRRRINRLMHALNMLGMRLSDS